MHPTHESIFSHTVTRPYPFKWFTGVTLFGGTLASVLIAFLSVATQGYELTTTYYSNPNITTAHNLFRKWPSFLTANTKISCSSTTIPVGAQFFTNNTALKYTLTNIWQGDDGAAPRTLMGALPYQSNRLQDCSVAAVAMEFESIERSASQLSMQQWGVKVQSWVNCDVDTAEGLVTINLTTSYDFNSAGSWYGVDGERFPGRNETSKASLWWGESLLAWYYIALVDQLHNATLLFDRTATNSALPIYKGSATFVRNATSPPSADDVKSLDFFHAGCYFVPFSGDGTVQGVYYCSPSLVSTLVNAAGNDWNAPLPAIWRPASTLAKVFYYTVLTDLGQQRQQDTGPNMLVDPELLSFFSANITAIGREKKDIMDHLNVTASTGLATSPFVESEASAFDLGISPSVISASYLCQTPRLKKTVSLLISVATNSVVLLSIIWKVYIWIIDGIFARKYPELNSCQGCAAASARSRIAPLVVPMKEAGQGAGVSGQGTTGYFTVHQTEADSEEGMEPVSARSL